MKGEGERREREKEGYWRKVIRKTAHSGLPIRELWRQRRLKEGQFYWCQRKLKERQEARALGNGSRSRDTKAGGHATFALVSKEPGRLEPAAIELVLRNGRRVRIGNGVDEERLRTVVGVLEGDGC